MTFDDYEYLAYRTASPVPYSELDRLNIAALGLNGEAGEFAEHIKKVIAHGHMLDREYLVKEIGDILWYCAYASRVLNIPLDDIATRNIQKLKARYPEGFSTDKSINRVEGRDSYESYE